MGYLALAGVTFRAFLFQRGLLLGGQEFDSHLFFYPRFWMQWQHGSIGWNPYQFFGAPFLADPQDCWYYPLWWPFKCLPVCAAINWSVAFHALLGAFFAYSFARSLGSRRTAAFASGMIFGFGSLFCCKIRTGYLTVLYTIALMPLVLLVLRRFLVRPSVLAASLLGVSIGLQILAGHAQFAAFTLGAGLIYLAVWIGCMLRERLGWRRIARMLSHLLLALVVAALASAVKLLPTTELMRLSNRPSLSYDEASGWHAEPPDALTLLVPDFFGDGVRNPYWARGFVTSKCFYLGVLSLLLVGVALGCRRDRETLALTLIGALGFVLALGPRTPVYRVAFACIPGFALFREPSRFLTLTGFAGAMLAGLGLDRLTNARHRVRRAVRVAAAIALALCVVALALVCIRWCSPSYVHRLWDHLVARWGEPETLASAQFADREQLAASCAVAFRGIAKLAVFAGLSALLLWGPLHGWSRGGVALCGIVVIWVDLFGFVGPFIIAERVAPALDLEAVQFLQSEPKGERFRVWYGIDPHRNLLPMHGVEPVGGYNPVELRRFVRFAKFDPAEAGPDSRTWREQARLLAAANVKYLMCPHGERVPRDVPAEKVAATANNVIYRCPERSPRAFLTTHWEAIPDAERQLARMMTDAVEPGRQVLLEAEPEGVAYSNAHAGTATIAKYESDMVEISVEADRPALLVLADAFYPGWTASHRADGEADDIKLPVVLANYMFRAVRVPAGRGLVTFRFRSATLQAGRVISLVTACALIAYWAACWWRARAGRSTSPKEERSS